MMAAMRDASGAMGRGYETVRLTDGVRFDLPQRPLGVARWLGLIPLLFGLAFIAFPVFMILPDVIATLADDDGFDPFALVMGVFLVPFVLGGLVPVALGLTVLIGRNTVTVRDGRLWAVERVGLFRRSRSRPIDAIRRIEVVTAKGKAVNTRGGDAPSQMMNLAGLAGLGARCDGAKDMMLAWGYPKQTLLAIADAVADAAQAERPARLLDDDEPQDIEVSERELSLTGDDDGGIERDEHGAERIPPQPTGSRSVLEVQDAGLTLRIPPAGLIKGSKGLFVFSLLWCGFMAVFTTLAVLAVTGVFEAESDIDSVGEALGAAAFVAVFWAVGIGMMIGAINAGRRQAVIDIVGTGEHATLLITRQSLFGTKQHEWPVGQLDRIRVGPSGMEVNNRPVMELQIHPTQGKKVGILRQLEDDQLRWIASNLRVALGVKR